MDEDENIVEDGEIDESNTSIDHQEHYNIDMDMDMDVRLTQSVLFICLIICLINFSG